MSNFRKDKREKLRSVRNGCLTFGRYEGIELQQVPSSHLKWIVGPKFRGLDTIGYRDIVEELECRGITLDDTTFDSIAKIDTGNKEPSPVEEKKFSDEELVEINALRKDMKLPPM